MVNHHFSFGQHAIWSIGIPPKFVPPPAAMPQPPLMTRLAIFHHFGKNFKVFGHFMRVYIVFGKFCLLWCKP